MSNGRFFCAVEKLGVCLMLVEVQMLTLSLGDNALVLSTLVDLSTSQNLYS